MKNAEAGLTYSNLLPFILAVLLIFLIPMLMRRYGLEWSDITRFLFSRPGKRDYAEAAQGKKKREPWQTNGRSQDLSGLVSTLMIFARRTKAGLVYPGTVQHGGRMANLVAFVVTKKEVIGINCFGFGGTITEQEGKWNQHMNGEDREIPDPVAGNASRVITMGFSVTPTEVTNFGITSKELDIRGSRLQNRKFQTAIDLIREGKVDLDHKISHTFPLLEAQKAFDFNDTRDPSIRKIVFTLD